jgi:uncharacterized protein (DUF1015 family)
MNIKPFAAVRPPKQYVQEVAARPYDVLNSQEAQQEAGEKSLLHITKPEIDFTPIKDEHCEEVFEKAVNNYKLWKTNKWLVQDEQEHYYIYAQTMGTRTQYGIVACCHCDDYLQGKIKKHELTRKEKEDERMQHILLQRANIEPVFLSYKSVPEIDDIIAKIIVSPPEYDFVSSDNIGHTFWCVNDDKINAKITQIFEQIPSLYIADGHHRTAAAARVGETMCQNNPNHTGNEEYNYFLAVIFSDSQLKIMEYNRIVSDMNGWSEEDLMEEIKKSFYVINCGTKPYMPVGKGDFSIYIAASGLWYALMSKLPLSKDTTLVENLDVSILNKYILEPLLGIKDLRTDKRIDFIGGVQGLKGLKQKVDDEKMAIGIALYPVTMKELIDIADNGEIMPPKTTWFEPKLRSGLFIHEF